MHRNHSPLPLERAREITAKAFRYRGIRIAVAKQLGTSVAHVDYVWKGVRRSPRVEQALNKAIERVERAFEEKAA